MKNGPIDKSKLAKTDQEYLNLLAGKEDWIVRTADDVRQLRQVRDCPLAKLDVSDFEKFLTSLKFKNGGLAHVYYKPLMSSLTLTEIFEVFERFGISREYLLTVADWSCNQGTGACVNESGYGCTSACGTQ